MGGTGVAPVDRRGKTAPPYNKTPDVMQLVHDHIMSLPTCTSHYSTQYRVYLPPGYSHKRCYDLFKEWCGEKEVPAEKIMRFDGYSRAFSRFNIGFRPPMVDTCNYCDKIANKVEVATANRDEAKKSQLLMQKKVQLLKAKVARDLMTAYKQDTNPTLFAFAMDL
ncbi:hypothetical protein E2C01_074571 [Portunus trituberculatus]|uniref:Uncharacterized protein n=1 Tax=Portunus trituberculatus TaxID=210409 RepID=A0A5B7IGM1_PORTR|nr:hypothetical protein [Portunus trituberculatus]